MYLFLKAKAIVVYFNKEIFEKICALTKYQKIGGALTSYDKNKNFFVYFFRPSACQLTITNVPGRNGTIEKNLFDLLCDPKNNLTRMLGYKYGFEPIHEEAAVLFTDKIADPFVEFFPNP